MKQPAPSKPTILAVDDDEINLMILVKTAQDAGYKVKSYGSATQAWDYLVRNPDSIDIALIDKMMPDMSGMDLLGCIKRNPDLKHLPVIFQTGDVGVEQVCDGLENGAYYYLTKPFSPEVLLAVLQSASNECRLREEILAQGVTEHTRFLTLLQDGEFSFSTHSRARLLAVALAQVSARPDHMARGLMELFSNAIEHGNLDIGYKIKNDLLLVNRWPQELMNRLSREEYRYRSVRVQVHKLPSSFNVTITDQGKGFDWRHYLAKDARTELNKPSGRGMAIARAVFPDIHYNAKGNEVQLSMAITSNQPAITIPKSAAAAAPVITASSTAGI